ncbi:MAG: hypothetical protein JSR77_11425 [Planctomycetes bacterium]|nr:hypothetical protein [Planctomycetota bacterium]
MTKNEAARRLPYLRRRYMISGGCFVAAVAVWAGAVVVAALLVGRSGGVGVPAITVWGLRLASVPPTCFAITFLVLNYRWRAKIRRLAASVGCRLCPRCCYDLTAAPELPGATGTTRCPECGEAVDLAEVERLWRDWAA